MIRLTFLITCLACSLFAEIPSTTNWRGLSPINSTRLDVERTLGPPSVKRDNEQMIYYFQDVVVYLYFYSNPKCQQKLSYTSWDVNSDTVTGMSITLRHSPSVEETGIDLTKFQKIRGAPDMIDHYYYVNREEDGFAVEVSNNTISGYHYAPGTKNKALRCERANQPNIR